MQRVSQERYLSVFKGTERLTQKEIAERAGVSITAASRAIKFLEGTGKLTYHRSPGMSMRYSLNSDLILRTPSGKKISDYFINEEPELYSDLFISLVKSAITEILNARSPENLRDLQRGIQIQILETFKNNEALWNTLISASYEQVEASRKDMNNEGKPLS